MLPVVDTGQMRADFARDVRQWDVRFGQKLGDSHPIGLANPRKFVKRVRLHLCRNLVNKQDCYD